MIVLIILFLSHFIHVFYSSILGLCFFIIFTCYMYYVFLPFPCKMQVGIGRAEANLRRQFISGAQFGGLPVVVF